MPSEKRPLGLVLAMPLRLLLLPPLPRHWERPLLVEEPLGVAEGVRRNIRALVSDCNAYSVRICEDQENGPPNLYCHLSHGVCE